MGNQTSVGVSRVVIQNDNDLWRIEKIEDDSPMCLFTSVKPHEERCEAGVKILRVLRHPNILKFLSSDSSLHNAASFFSELVYPLQCSLPSQSLEGVVRGWRDVGCGLSFVHTKVGLTHNNLHVGCVFVGGADSKWKIGGFELSSKLKLSTKKFFQSVSTIRHRDATPPEDEEDSTIDAQAVPIHSRDTWAFGNMMLQTIEDMNDEEDVPDEIIYYINNEMLNQSPELRPSMSEIMIQSWMNNTTTGIIDFLANLTLKPQTDKDEFFRSLANKLHLLPALIVAEHIVPLVLSPLVMAEPIASKHLWQHLLCPVSDRHPRNNEFKSTGINPLLEEDQFRSHVLPPLLNLLESREYHIRLILLHNLQFFCYLCTEEDLMDVVLPEVLVGLKDTRDDIVAGTLHALAELIPFVGSDVVMGTARKNMFADTRPKIQSISSHVYTPSIVTEYNPPPTSLSSTDERIIQKKNETMSEGNYITLLKNKEEMGTESDSSLAPNKPVAMKYSPSASIDDSNEHKNEREEENDDDEEEDYGDEEWEGFETVNNGGTDQFSTDWGKWDNEETNEEEEEEEREGDKNIDKSVDNPTGNNNITTDDATTRSISQGKSSTAKLLLKGSKYKEEKGVVNNSIQPPEDESELRKTLKGQLSEDDMKRLEEKAEWSAGVDLFADMAPKITHTVRHSIETKEEQCNNNVSEESRSVGLQGTTSLTYDYNPPETEVVDDAWGDDEWNDEDIIL